MTEAQHRQLYQRLQDRSREERRQFQQGMEIEHRIYRTFLARALKEQRRDPWVRLVQAVVKCRRSEQAEGHYRRADALRASLESQGIRLIDEAEGTWWQTKAVCRIAEGSSILCFLPVYFGWVGNFPFHYETAWMVYGRSWRQHADAQQQLRRGVATWSAPWTLEDYRLQEQLAGMTTEELAGCQQ